MSIRLDLDVKGKGLTFDENKLTTDWDEASSVEKRENGIYLYDVAGGLDNWTIVSYSGSNGIKTNDEVVQYIYAFSRYPVDETRRDPQALGFLTEYEKCTEDVVNEINWLHNNGYPQRAQWFPKEHDLMIFKGVGVPLNIHELYGDLVNKTCEDGLRYPDSVCEALFVIEHVEYTDSDSDKLPIKDMDIRCLWSSENCNVKPGELLPKTNRTSYSGTQPNRSPDGVVGNYYAYDFEPATFPPYNSNDTASTSGTVESTVGSYSGAYQKEGGQRKNIYGPGWVWVPGSSYVEYNDDGFANAVATSGHYEYVGTSGTTSTDGDFYQLFYGNKKSVYENAGYSFGDIFKVGTESNYYRKSYYTCEIAIAYDPTTDLVTMRNGYKFPLWFLRNVKYHKPEVGDNVYVLCADHYGDDDTPYWNDNTPMVWTDSSRSPVIGDVATLTSIDSNNVATIKPIETNDSTTYKIALDCLIKANHYVYGHSDPEMWKNIRSIGDSWNRTFYPSLVSIKDGASVEFVKCGTCVDPDHIWEFSPGTNPYGSQAMVVLRTFDKLNKALVTPATITKLQYTTYQPDYKVGFGAAYSKQNYAIVVSMDDLNVITGGYDGYTSSAASQTTSLPISQETYDANSTGSSYYSKGSNKAPRR